MSAGASCQLSLTYAPTAADAGSLSLGFTYTNNSGIVKSGTSTVVPTRPTRKPLRDPVHPTTGRLG